MTMFLVFVQNYGSNFYRPCYEIKTLPYNNLISIDNHHSL